MKGQKFVDWTMPIMLALVLACAFALLAVIFTPVIEQAQSWLLNAMGLVK